MRVPRCDKMAWFGSAVFAGETRARLSGRSLLRAEGGYDPVKKAHSCRVSAPKVLQ